MGISSVTAQEGLLGLTTDSHASEEEGNTVVELQARVMNAFIADPAAWLRRERGYLKIDNSKRRLRGGHIASDASFGILSSGHTTASRLSSEDRRTEDAGEDPVSPAYTNSEYETCTLPESRLTAERGTHFLALDDATSCLKMRYQEGELLKDFTRRQQVARGCQELAFRYHSCEAHMGGCLERVNTKWLIISIRYSVGSALFELKRVEHESNYVISDATRCGNLFPTTKRASVALAGILQAAAIEKHSKSLQPRCCCFRERCKEENKAKDEKKLSAGVFDSICEERYHE
ncbi:hypothetical protein FOXB_17049 [Fusarium oxysporum f. sp. conglutinans Fo5176]|uniref:Uncharacterized protein n=1 Tax=Fusarium oxysporum (strain Fo5176) TaxID=660025 RepID=F9GEG5_FUSOF|nr:hypothetical protein FOXB_17049 [Fusarium oxysporum f. sp. conglutinans Fo5176]